jgi:hydroxymethylpyrimidine/phosphomethylpyrimidine kinase
MDTADSAPLAPPLALCLGGFDPSGGAGLLRDVMTLSALGVQPMAVATCTTVQNGAGCQEILAADPLPALRALGPHLGGRWGVKLGLCPLTGPGLEALIAQIEAFGPALRIWDPIQAPSCGVGLHDPDSLRSMARGLLPSGGWVVCPNRPEAAALSGCPSQAPAAELAAPLLELGAQAVWLKGGHDPEDRVEDFWITAQGVRSLGRSPRLAGEVRGTGCTLGSAWLALALQGQAPVEAAIAAARFLRSQWPRAQAPGGFGRPSFAPVAR